MVTKKINFWANALLLLAGIVVFSNLLIIKSDVWGLVGLILYGGATLLLVIVNYKKQKIFSIVLVVVFIYLILAYLFPF